MFFKICFIIATAILMAIDVFIAILAGKQKNSKGLSLCVVCISSTFVSFFYLLSASFESKIATSAFSSAYFVSVTVMCFSMLHFVIRFTGFYSKKISKYMMLAGFGYLTFETILFTINIFHPIAIDYILGYKGFAPYLYQMKPLYFVHLAVAYTSIIFFLVLLIIKSFHVPKEYRLQYSSIVYGVVIVVIINAGFLFIKSDSLWTRVDYSILTYSLACFIIYWCAFQYRTHGMLNHLKSYIFENVEQGILLFDYTDKLILFNERSTFLLPNITIKNDLSIEDFLIECKINIRKYDTYGTLQCYMNSNPLRCDYRKLINNQNHSIGKLLVFSDAIKDTDLLTGYHAWDSFQMFIKDNPENFPAPVAVAVVDLNRMALYNNIHGRNAGDQLIRKLAEKMKLILPTDCYFVRGHDALLISICQNSSEEEMTKYLKELADEFEEKLQYSIIATTKENPGILNAIETAIVGLNAKKLLDKESTHSAMLTSLVKALQECDPDTEKHVERTQAMGQALGKRIGLSDVDLSKLSLLCLLHDIGKIGVPLEILNKPGKLNDEEWTLIKSHVEKGYSIAQSSPELAGIADMILYHHERWDGKGYPIGLTRESIPVLSRIISIVDAFDAMVNNRSYRKALSLEEAKAELKRCAGTQFDPYLTNEFLQYLEEDFFFPSLKQSTVIPTTRLEMEETAIINESVHSLVYSKYILDSSLNIISIDAEFTNTTGYTSEDISKGMTQFDLLPEQDRLEYITCISSALAKSPQAYFEHRILCKNGAIKNTFCLGRKYFDSAAREERSEVIITLAKDTYYAKSLASSLETKSTAQLKQWEKTYRTDPLTGLLTHISFMNDIEEYLIKNPEQHLMLIMMDIDKFKEYNDTYGHHAGDEFLIQVANAIQSTIDSNALCSRMGGDEFSIALWIKNNEEYKKDAVKIFNKVHLVLTNYATFTSLSMGATTSFDGVKTFNKLYERADQALYESKKNGRNQITFK